jgi:hypothetical protein
MATSLYTVGHSTRSSDELIGILREHDIGGVADVRRFPGSRRHPQFGRDVLTRSLPAAGIGYAWFEPTGRAAVAAERCAAVSVARAGLCDVRGLHEHRSVRGGDRPPAGMGGARPGGGHVRGGRALQLSPAADLGLGLVARRGGHPPDDRAAERPSPTSPTSPVATTGASSTRPRWRCLSDSRCRQRPGLAILYRQSSAPSIPRRVDLEWAASAPRAPSRSSRCVTTQAHVVRLGA